MMIKNENIRQGIFPRGQKLRKEKVYLDGFDAYVRGLWLGDCGTGAADNN